mgnify:CR=1 FL=1|jgi:hypothetical protein
MKIEIIDLKIIFLIMLSSSLIFSLLIWFYLKQKNMH